MKLARSVFSFCCLLVCAGPLFSSPTEGLFETDIASPIVIVDRPTDGGIREVVPDKYRARFDQWKAEFLATEVGRQDWDRYAQDKSFILTIVVSGSRGKGAGTDKYLWSESGELVGATITLGSNIDEGYPSPVYYPVLNALSVNGDIYSISGKILAATKLSHEMGHVKQTASANMNVQRLQDQLMPQYNSLFLQNGRNTTDKKLVELATRMEGTPIEIWESREYWSEVAAMLFLNEKISKEVYRCDVLKKIKQNLESYARDYEGRFLARSEFSSSPCLR